ncbi:MAG: hypothetical protein ABIY50_01745 [Ignavibacteria bacterium]
MKLKKLLILILFTAAAFNGCGLLSKKYTKIETSDYKIYGGNKKKILIENINGNVTISQTSDTDHLTIKAYKEIKVKKKYLETPFDEINIMLDTNSENISVKTEISKKGSDGIFNLSREQRVDYEIYLPGNIEIEIDNVNGKVISSVVKNNLKITLINGDVDISNFTGKLACEITNGSFSGKIDSTSGIDINTINGSVTLFLNNYMNANLKAESVNSRITNENLQFRDLMQDKKLLRGKLGNVNSDTHINIETINGKIKLYGRNEI